MIDRAVLAGVVALTASGPAHRPGCEKTYTVRMDERAALAIYTGRRRVTRRQLRLLGRLEVCQRNSRERPRVRAFNHRHHALWHARRYPPPVSWNGPAVASWYDDSGTTGCGFHATYGIATFVVPCGGKVTLRHGSSTVTAVRDDSGPYVSGRTFDLDPAVKAALGCGDLCSVDWRVG